MYGDQKVIQDRAPSPVELEAAFGLERVRQLCRALLGHADVATQLQLYIEQRDGVGFFGDDKEDFEDRRDERDRIDPTQPLGSYDALMRPIDPRGVFREAFGPNREEN